MKIINTPSAWALWRWPFAMVRLPQRSLSSQ